MDSAIEQRVSLEGAAINGWLPIETAPRDGTFVLVTHGHARDGCLAVVMARRGPNAPNFVEGEGWECQGGGWYMGPRFWQPLPEMPK